MHIYIYICIMYIYIYICVFRRSSLACRKTCQSVGQDSCSSTACRVCIYGPKKLISMLTWSLVCCSIILLDSSYVCAYVWAHICMPIHTYVYTYICIRRIDSIAYWAAAQFLSPHSCSFTAGMCDIVCVSVHICVYMLKKLLIMPKNSSVYLSMLIQFACLQQSVYAYTCACMCMSVCAYTCACLCACAFACARACACACARMHTCVHAHLCSDR